MQFNGDCNQRQLTAPAANETTVGALRHKLPLALVPAIDVAVPWNVCERSDVARRRRVPRELAVPRQCLYPAHPRHSSVLPCVNGGARQCRL